MKKIRTIIADDEPLARERIRSFLAEESDVELVAECRDGAETLKESQRHQPDLLFLDVQMPRLNGFEVLEALAPGTVPVVIFTTAHDAHAIRAFEFSALDYLLKPFSEARFKISLQKARSRLEMAARPAESGSAGGRIFVRSAERILFLKPEEISRVEAAGNYVVLHAGKDQHILRETISAMEARLAQAGFMRVSRSVVVNLACIREIQPAGSGRYSLLLKTGTRLDMTCSLTELQARLGAV
ncbi:MAG: response regulator transcription factor [Verrucomicrobia bacterium]|nr:response regulator transcription factor [Verrucomicrobiota bacterium]